MRTGKLLFLGKINDTSTLKKNYVVLSTNDHFNFILIKIIFTMLGLILLRKMLIASNTSE